MSKKEIEYIKIGSYGGYKVYKDIHAYYIWEIQSNPTREIKIPAEIFHLVIEKLKAIK